MKSRKAKEFIDGLVDCIIVDCIRLSMFDEHDRHLAKVEIGDYAKEQLRSVMTHAVKLTEQEAEERVRTELKYFHTPQELPPNDKEVLGVINSSYNHYVVLKHNDLGWWMPAVVGGWCVCPFSVLAWREILE